MNDVAHLGTSLSFGFRTMILEESSKNANVPEEAVSPRTSFTRIHICFVFPFLSVFHNYLEWTSYETGIMRDLPCSQGLAGSR